jgi:uncharacterized phage protein (TIGR02218 family)
MKSLSPALAAHLAEDCTNLAYLLKITRSDGVVRAYTNHDADLVVGGVTYKADGAFNPSALASSSALSTDNLALNGMVSATDITAEDLTVGRYDQARCDLYVCNWADLSQGVLQLRRGWIGAVKLQGGQYQANLLGLHDRLQHTIGDYYTATCRHALGGTGCGVALASYTVTGSVTATIDATAFNDSACTEADAYFSYGTLTWTSGANSGLAVEIHSYSAATRQFTLWLPLPNAPALGDTYQAIAGCDKRLTVCTNKFANTLNFGGFPHLPGVDKILAYPDSHA